MQIRLAHPADLDQLAQLFDAYRQFYGQPSDLPGGRAFLSQRMERSESVLLVAVADDAQLLGFTQLYPAFTSTLMKPILILNDLFVVPQARTRGIGAALLAAAAEYGRATGAIRLSLATAIDNRTAQSLYEANGCTRETDFLRYNLALS